MKKSGIIYLTFFLLLHWSLSDAQGKISIQCKELNLSVSVPLKSEPISEDDPGDLAEATSFLLSFYGNTKSSHQSFQLRFPARMASHQWTQSGEDDKNDSLYAWLSYDVNPAVYGHILQAYPKDFSIEVTRYDHKVGGKIEGRFEGTMGAYLSWSQQNITIRVKGNFQTTRTGKSEGECRKQRRSEHEVINKSVAIFDETFLRPLQKIGWHITEQKNGRTSQLAVNPSPFRPIFLCSEFYDLKLSLDPNSDYGKVMNDSLQYYADQVSQRAGDHKAIANAVKNMYRIKSMQEIEISISENSPYLKEDYHIGSKDRSSELHIPGIPFAWQLFKAPTDEVGTPEEITMLFFGNWKGANMHSGTYMAYPFIHKQQSPYIENLVVKINAPASAANNIIKHIDWGKLNHAITK